MAIRFWLGVAQRDHVLRGVAQGIAQFSHGSRAAAARLGEADGLVYYSPKTAYPDGDRLQEFTAIGRVSPGEPYQADDGTTMTRRDGDTYRPWRIRIAYDTEARPASIRPLLGMLDLTAPPNWGIALRRGLLELSRRDYDLIRRQMHPTPGERSS